MEMFIDGLKTKGFHDKLKSNHFHIQQKKKKKPTVVYNTDLKLLVLRCFVK